ncbi:MAG: nitrile hydratase subunit beta [Reyranellaceae bacterium]
MNGVHDMGGMHGFGPVQPEVDEPVFHAPWEGKVYAMRRLMGAWRRWNIDAGRHAIERIPAAEYLRSSYYEKWLQSLETLLIERGVVTAGELSTGRADPAAQRMTPPVMAADVPAIATVRGSSERETSVPARFAIGQQVRAKIINPVGHTRLPRYVRGRQGTVELDHGAHVFPDSNAHFQGEAAHRLYTVRFAARELWGEAAKPADAVLVDLWEAYLEPV